MVEHTTENRGVDSSILSFGTIFDFLNDLKEHNTREWFDANRERYLTSVERPAQAFVSAVAPWLAAVSPQFSASPRARGGAFAGLERRGRFPIHGAPFRTDVILRFPHRARRIRMPPMFYLHIEPGRSFGGGGMYHPDPASLALIRRSIDAHRDDWQAVLATAPIVHAESLTRTPAGYPADHPFAADLKRKGHVVMANYSDDEVMSAAFLERFVETCQTAAPLVGFLTRALALPWSA